jgi:hypothetical protein
MSYVKYKIHYDIMSVFLLLLCLFYSFISMEAIENWWYGITFFQISLNFLLLMFD